MIEQNLIDFGAEALYFRTRARYHHWNTQGPTFLQDHEYFDDLYAALDDQVDQVAEWTRGQGVEFPDEIALAQHLEDPLQEMDGLDMQKFTWQQLQEVGDANANQKLESLNDRGALPWFEIFVLNERHIDNLKSLAQAAERADEIGIVNGVEDWLQDHDKVKYFVGSTLKKL